MEKYVGLASSYLNRELMGIIMSEKVMKDKYIIDEYGQKRLKDVEFILPICVGTVAWWQGKKASEHNTHKWTVYARGPNNEDLSYIIKKVTFELHETFASPRRTIEQQPFEVTEAGWGQFDIGITLHFTPDARESEVTMYHMLKLYEDDGSPNTLKKPVVSETYEELVFSEPHEDFYNRVSCHVPVPSTVLMSQAAWVPRHDETAELARLQAARAKIANLAASDVRRPLVDPMS
ncbi:hypothetical protein CEUSTIGMA_g10099.t1 [Chlamydomonas eustigma]|uniref:YEATS domain-containing protein n=1 Tax=Chlamydomonas eustigma TaxID=1157962 RepID=A0A250XHZ8_9CHLO|nr:hypothetical protein CEUSTIGMA_g10099.t1 [Chlamydomonas eustigma]|eukprot:GAX82673.1 hypothetical protein CEUSTIGMA_g10099.t1 [Chlamydomonas eustigma]